MRQDALPTTVDQDVHSLPFVYTLDNLCVLPTKDRYIHGKSRGHTVNFVFRSHAHILSHYKQNELAVVFESSR
jgi:hypothetical protein